MNLTDNKETMRKRPPSKAFGNFRASIAPPKKRPPKQAASITPAEAGKPKPKPKAESKTRIKPKPKPKADHGGGTSVADTVEKMSWNIFTGGGHKSVQNKLRLACREEPIYVAVDVNLNKQEFGGDVTVLLICTDANSFPEDLRSRISHLARYNDHAWVTGIRRTGTQEGVAVWYLELE